MTQEIIVVGGGIMGCSLALHLARRGRSVLVLERGQIASGTTWHAAGLVAELRATPSLTELARYTGALYEELERDGYATGFKRTGALTVATTESRWEELRRNAAMANQHGVPCEVLADLAAARERFPWLHLDDACGLIHMPRDGQISPVDACNALAAAARAAGAEIRTGSRVLGLEVKHDRIAGVRTAEGIIAADQVVVCAGLWTDQITRDAGVRVPIHAAEHYYAVTEIADALPHPIPTVRDPDGGVYLKSDAGRVLIGCFETEAKPLNADELPEDFEFDELPFDLEHFAPWLANGLQRIPALEQLGIRRWFNGPEGFTPDDRYLLGPVRELPGLFIGGGFNSIGIQSAGGAGSALAQWICEGRPPPDLWDVDIRRMLPFQFNRNWLADRTRETVGLLYADHWPRRQFRTGRNLRRTPLYERLIAQGAAFGELAGWERANFYVDPGSETVSGEQDSHQPDWRAPNWRAASAREHLAVRNDAAVLDLSSFAKFEVVGDRAAAALSAMSTASLDVPIGKVVYTQWTNPNGGIEADVTITRMARDRFLVVTAAASQRHDFEWLCEHIHSSAAAVDVTSGLGVIALMGPRSRDILAGLTDADLGNEAFPFGTSQLIDIGPVTARATRITYVGELGWEFYVPTEQTAALYDSLCSNGDLAHAGYFAVDSLRLEKAYRHWGHDIGDADTVLEAGLGFTIDWEHEFPGREALAAQREQGLTRRLCVFHADTHLAGQPEPATWHDEPILRDGQPVGWTTSGGWSPALGGSIALGYVSSPTPITARSLRESEWHIEIAGERIPARVGLRPLYDPGNERIRS